MSLCTLSILNNATRGFYVWNSSCEDTDTALLGGDGFCGETLLKNYSEWHTQEVLQLNENCSNTMRTKLIVYTCHAGQLCGGLGDRLSGIISAFFLAVATDRLFLIDYSDPVSLDETLVPNTFQWNVGVINTSCVRNLELKASITLNGIDASSSKTLLDEIFEAHATGVPVIRIHLNRYHSSLVLWEGRGAFTRSYVGMLHRRARCYAEHVRAETTFKHAFSALFRFSTRVTDRSNQIVNALGLRDDVSAKIVPFVGVHARIGGGLWSDPSRHRVDQLHEFLECAHSKTRSVSTSVRSLSKHSSSAGEIPIVVFSDSEEFKMAATAADEYVKSFNSSLIHIDKSNFSDPINVAQGNIDSFAEIDILSRARCIVGSSSTFSGVAAALQHEGFCFAKFSSCENDRLDYFYDDEKHKLESLRSSLDYNCV